LSVANASEINVLLSNSFCPQRESSTFVVVVTWRLLVASLLQSTSRMRRYVRYFSPPSANSPITTNSVSCFAQIKETRTNSDNKRPFAVFRFCFLFYQIMSSHSLLTRPAVVAHIPIRTTIRQENACCGITSACCELCYPGPHCGITGGDHRVQ